MKSLVILSGLSGSGKSTAVKSLEDLGFFCVDNLPPKLIPVFIDLCEHSAEEISKVALVVDIRERVFFEHVTEVIKELKKKDYNIEIVFLDASDEVIVQRYTESRRRHPLARNGNIIEGIAKEREMLSEVKELADHNIDTSEFNIHQLREIIQNIFGDKNVTWSMSVNFLSFGFKYGFPYDADIVLDVRFLPSPHFVEELKDQTGLDEDVKQFVLGNQDTKKFVEKVVDILKFLIPRYEKEGKSYLTVAIGCTGGRHRSVAIVNEIADRFRDLSPEVRHRDVMKR